MYSTVIGVGDELYSMGWVVSTTIALSPMVNQVEPKECQHRHTANSTAGADLKSFLNANNPEEQVVR